MMLVVGLGNPGQKYDDTRHNIGFEVLDSLAERVSARVSDKKFKALVGRSHLADQDFLLMKPQTYMNLSGESVGPALGFYKLSTKDVVVVHDDLDLPLGRIQIKKGGGHGGHNGLRSLKQHLPDDGFIRIRVGVGRPPPRWDTADYVLSRFKGEEAAEVERVVEVAIGAIESIIKDGLPKAMNLHNRTPKKSKKPSASRDEPKEEKKSHEHDFGKAP